MKKEDELKLLKQAFVNSGLLTYPKHETDTCWYNLGQCVPWCKACQSERIFRKAKEDIDEKI